MTVGQERTLRKDDAGEGKKWAANGDRAGHRQGYVELVAPMGRDDCSGRVVAKVLNKTNEDWH
jgi:hypothetical protein